MILDVLTFPNDILRKKSQPVEEITEDIVRLINNMTETMYSQKGLGLAAPQVGVNKRVVVIDYTGGEEPDTLLQLINPEIIAKDGEQFGDEGCLSIPGEYEKVRRYANVVLRALSPSGEQIEIEADGLLARACQHEIDHLDGVLFIDHLAPYKRDIVKKHIKKRMADGDYGTPADVKS